MNRYSVLIIDDDESTHDVLGDCLKLAGYTVYDAHDGSMGLELIRVFMPDLVVLDINMPVMDGFETMEAIAKDRQMRDIPVLFLTSHDRSEVKKRGLDLGADDFIVKPFNQIELLARIEAALRRSKRFRKNEKVMSGELSDIALVELMQTLSMSQKTAHICLKDIGGVIYVERGDLIHATYREFSGKAAVMRIFFLEKGTFSMIFGPISEGIPRNPLPIQNTLLDALTYIDELKVILGAYFTENALIEIGNTVISGISKFRKLSPIHLYDLIAFMEGDLKENALQVSEELDRKKLSVVQDVGGMGRSASNGVPVISTASDSDLPIKEKCSRLFELGFDKYLEGNYQEALALWEEATVINPDDKILATNIAMLQKKLKSKER